VQEVHQRFHLEIRPQLAALDPPLDEQPEQFAERVDHPVDEVLDSPEPASRRRCISARAAMSPAMEPVSGGSPGGTMSEMAARIRSVLVGQRR
jgi:hypothetical protein